MISPDERWRPHHPLWKGFVKTQVPPLRAGELAPYAGKRILVTGAGGFLGSALARRLARTAAAHLTLLDSAEYGLYRLDQHLRARIPAPPACSLVVGSINDRTLMEQLFTRNPPQVVFHAAACKHVPLMEQNPFAAAETNSLGTLALVNAAAQANVEAFVLLSTDKAVQPISVMGATKRLAEQIVLAARQQTPHAAAFNAVRLCNVLGSTGSVAPLFARQIAAGGPVTLTHPEATRFFLTTTDALRHLLRAAFCRTATGLLVPSVHPPRRVADLAAFVLAHAQAPSPFAVTYTGLRPADKLHEQLLGPAEHTAASPAALLRDVVSPFSAPQLADALRALELALAARDQPGLLAALRLAVPDYTPAPSPVETPSRSAAAPAQIA